MSPNDRIRIALLGAGGMGQGDTADGAQGAGRRARGGGRHLRRPLRGGAARSSARTSQTTRDYREILARKDVDAVIVASPDHWHAQMAIDALEAGKDVYCEKPMMHAIDEGVRMLEAQKRTGRILQVGSQCVSSIVYEKARELFASGALGQVNLIEGWTNRNSVMGALHWPIPKDASPADDRLGPLPRQRAEAAVRAGAPLPLAALQRLRHRHHRRPVRPPVLRACTSSPVPRGPSRVFCSGGLRYWTDGREIPDVHGRGLRLPRARQRRRPSTSP